jgi:hypothetical protein
LSGPVAQSGLRRRPSEPENGGSNPSGPAFNFTQIVFPGLDISSNPFEGQSIEDSSIGLFHKAYFQCRPWFKWRVRTLHLVGGTILTSKGGDGRNNHVSRRHPHSPHASRSFPTISFNRAHAVLLNVLGFELSRTTKCVKVLIKGKGAYSGVEVHDFIYSFISRTVENQSFFS